MKVVLDANILVSAAISRGASHRIVQSWMADANFEVVICPQLLDEVRDVLTRRPRLRRFIDIAVANDFIGTVEALADCASDPSPESIETTTRDRDDDYLVALARLHNADLIVTGDRDLLEWEDQHPAVVTPADFERILRGNTQLP